MRGAFLLQNVLLALETFLFACTFVRLLIHYFQLSSHNVVWGISHSLPSACQCSPQRYSSWKCRCGMILLKLQLLQSSLGW